MTAEKSTTVHALDVTPGLVAASTSSKSYPPMQERTDWEGLAINVYRYRVYQGNQDEFFQFGIAPLCIFCAAIFSIFWGTSMGLLIKKIDMNDYSGVQECIKRYAKDEETIRKAGLKKQDDADTVMKVLKDVGIRITNGAKAFLYKEYIYLTIWSCSFAVVLGATVDLLEMSVERAPTNFPYTAVSFLTGSFTSIASGYIGMRIAVFTNTRVTFHCCQSVHKGFVTAFRGGQVLGFVLVGLGILNIMILIMIFKATWYNGYIKEVVAAGRPISQCPGHNVTVAAGTATPSLYNTHWEEANANLKARYEWTYATAYFNWFTSTVNAARWNTAKKDQAGVCASDTGAHVPKADQVAQPDQKWFDKLHADPTFANAQKVFSDIAAFFDQHYDNKGTVEHPWDGCKAVAGVDAFGKSYRDCTHSGSVTATKFEDRYQFSCTQDVSTQQTFGEYFDTHNADGLFQRHHYFWTNENQLDCEAWFNAEDYKWRQRVCVLTRRFFELIAGYGLGGSSVALFGRVGGGIYTKAADVGADLVGKVIKDLKEDDINNPGTIADNVGDNVGDIAGMGSDLFGSLAESTCAALVVSSTSYELVNHPNSLFFPISVTASGTIASWLSVLLVHMRTTTYENVQSVLKTQIGASTLFMTGCVIPAVLILPSEFTFEGGAEKIPITVTRWQAYGCVMFGLWSGMIIGFITEYYTNNAYSPTLWLANACEKGPAPNIILGLALGYVSVVVPITCITATIGYAFATTGMYGVGLSALGMLGSLPVALSVDGFGPISDNAGGVAEMSGLPPEIRDLTDSLDAAGNTTAAVGKGFAIGSACLVGLALFGAFITRIGDTSVDILKPVQFAGLLVGAMNPYFFTAMTMKAVGDAAYDMMDFIINDIREGDKKKQRGEEYVPDFDGCIRISTKASLKMMIAPGALVIGSPLVAGFVFGPHATAGVLAGNIVSGVQLAFSQSNSGGAWDNAKKEIEAGKAKFRLKAEEAGVDLAKFRIEYAKLAAFRYTGEVDANGVEVEAGLPAFDRARFDQLSEWMDKDTELREAHVASIVGDTVGDPLKDTSGPAINILVKLSAITSLVFGNYLAHYHIFGNAAAPIHQGDALLLRCNTLGDNPNTAEYTRKLCEDWLGKEYFGYNMAKNPGFKLTKK